MQDQHFHHQVARKRAVLLYTNAMLLHIKLGYKSYLKQKQAFKITGKSLNLHFVRAKRATVISCKFQPPSCNGVAVHKGHPEVLTKMGLSNIC